jgi:cobalt-zinc-cadmium efflux system membrane fusion protein
VENPGFLHIGMFVTAIFHGQSSVTHAAIPATAILHLHDRYWVFAPSGNGYFKRVEVTSGVPLPDNQQEILNGLSVGAQVVQNALVLENTVEQ